MTIVRTLLLLSVLATGPAWAETLSLPTGDPTASLERPNRGITMSAVQSRYGDPVTRHAAVGQPPITRWDYARFAVYCENDHVLHTVIVR